jgi:hypothetical protein
MEGIKKTGFSEMLCMMERGFNGFKGILRG